MLVKLILWSDKIYKALFRAPGSSCRVSKIPTLLSVSHKSIASSALYAFAANLSASSPIPVIPPNCAVYIGSIIGPLF